ncbi:hypothetical protein OHA74_20815 [Streptomyces phaeochromogenes]|uniref:hypothetical protein n=1 Tax=Streptomyces phaeochromogenes TaxID=1923 RepID=UPI002E281D7C|nr:hypothetical protein [Streptomyces phaeochromogenes]
MMRIEWTIASMEKGPVVGSYVTSSLDSAMTAIESAFYNAIGPSWGPIHTQALRGFENEFRRDAINSLNKEGKWEFKMTAVVISLTWA